MLIITEIQRTFTVRHTVMPYKNVQHISVRKNEHVPSYSFE